ncbi:class I SAM-dependent methyltransferase [Schaalia sp. Marseille-Q2122]|uniref:class I SAM-dependent methyltransferase n=1 Tax=Schaalia sp. Marseille-Q2122 TaxID=2736604 RepID=UPI00158C6781|nr:class I SAM-dependent methyltransferase [Schaalia sp. Marseille-Q2122]
MTDASLSANVYLDKNPEHIATLFDRVAARYDLNNALLTGGMDHVWLRAVRNAVAPQPGELLLDVAAGTGASSAVLAATGAQVVACDISEGMIEVGRQRHPEIEFVHGNAMDMDFEDDTFDAVTIVWGLRNIPETDTALKEMLRVTKPGGRLVVCEFSTPPNPSFRRLFRGHMEMVIPPIAKAFADDPDAYDYLVESILAWPDQEELGRMILESGWENVEYRNLTGGIAALHRATKPVV